MLWIQILILILGLAALPLLMRWIMNRMESSDYTELIDDVYFTVPSVALMEMEKQTAQMFTMTTQNIRDVMELFQRYDERISHEVSRREWQLNRYERKLSEYLSRLTGNRLSELDSRRCARMHLAIGNLEMIGNCAIKLRKTAQAMSVQNCTFSQSGREKLYVLSRALTELLSLLTAVYQSDEPETLEHLTALRTVIAHLIVQLREKTAQERSGGTAEAEQFYSCVLNDAADIAERCEMLCGNLQDSILPGKTDRNTYGRGWLRAEDFNALVADYSLKYLVS